MTIQTRSRTIAIFWCYESCNGSDKGIRQSKCCFTAHHEHIEDWNTTMYLSQLCHVENKVVPMSELRITKDALVDKDGAKIDVLYRQTYPIEDLIEDQDPETGDLVGVELSQLVKAGKLL